MTWQEAESRKLEKGHWVVNIVRWLGYLAREKKRIEGYGGGEREL